MKRQPWFWPVKLFLKRVAGKELWLRPEVHHELRQRDSWKYIPGLLGADAIVYSVGVGDLIDFVACVRLFGVRVGGEVPA